jgi:hypothetical protein
MNAQESLVNNNLKKKRSSCTLYYININIIYTDTCIQSNKNNILLVVVLFYILHISNIHNIFAIIVYNIIHIVLLLFIVA